MNYKAICTWASALSLPFGLAFPLAPGATLGVYGITSVDAPMALLGRFYGAEILMYAAATFGLRGLMPGDAQGTAARALAVGTSTALGVSLLAMQGGMVNAFGWSTVALFAVFVLAWARVGWNAAGQRQAA
jgi:hypothetical protein